MEALEVFSDMSERVNYNLPGFPLFARRYELRQFNRYTAACHWHPDLEFILILEGIMDYFVNGQTCQIGKDDGIFVNSKRLHYGFSGDNSDCSFIAVVINPAVLGENTPMGKSFFDLKFGFDTNDYILLKPEVQWQKKILTFIKRIHDEINKGVDNPLNLLSLAASLCACAADNIQPILERQENKQNAHTLMAVRKMTGFVFQNYGNKITIDDIAAAGAVCRSKCCKLFGEYVGQSPNAYLAGYRIRKSCEMLKESNMSITEIAMTCGFQSPSYFTTVFQKETGLTPMKYRDQSNQ